MEGVVAAPAGGPAAATMREGGCACVFTYVRTTTAALAGATTLPTVIREHLEGTEAPRSTTLDDGVRRGIPLTASRAGWFKLVPGSRAVICSALPRYGHFTRSGLE